MNLHRTLGTAAWNTKSVIGKASEFVAVTIIDTTFDGLPGDFSNAKSIFKPLLWNAVIGGIPADKKAKENYVTRNVP